MENYRKSLTIIWFCGAGFTFFLLILQALLGHYQNAYPDVFGWFLPSVMPTISLIAGVWITQSKGKMIAIATPDKNLFSLTKWLSVAYLLTLALTIMIQPFSSFHPLDLMKMSHIWLGPFQGLVVATMGAFFTKQT